MADDHGMAVVAGRKWLHAGHPDRHYFFAWPEVTGYRLRPSTAAGPATDAVAKTQNARLTIYTAEGPILVGPAHERGETTGHAGTLAGPNRPFAVTVFSTRRSDIESYARPWKSKDGPGNSCPSTLHAGRSTARAVVPLHPAVILYSARSAAPAMTRECWSHGVGSADAGLVGMSDSEQPAEPFAWDPKRASLARVGDLPTFLKKRLVSRASEGVDAPFFGRRKGGTARHGARS